MFWILINAFLLLFGLPFFMECFSFDWTLYLENKMQLLPWFCPCFSFYIRGKITDVLCFMKKHFRKGLNVVRSVMSSAESDMLWYLLVTSLERKNSKRSTTSTYLNLRKSWNHSLLESQSFSALNISKLLKPAKENCITKCSELPKWKSKTKRFAESWLKFWVKFYWFEI